MKYGAATAVITAAEARVADGRRETRAGFRRTRAAIHTTLTRPSTLIVAAGVAGLAGFVLARAWRVLATPAAAPTGMRATAAGAALAWVVRQGLVHWPQILKAVAYVRRGATPSSPGQNSPPAASL